MDTKQKISFYWLLMGVCFVLHNLLHLFGLFFGEDIRLPNTTGEVPSSVQVFNTIVMTGTLVMSLLAAHLDGKVFRLFSLVWNGLFLLLNTWHLCETLFIEKFDVSQAVLLTFVLAINVLLTLALWKSIRQGKKK